jgi:plasmid maintenance system antidote protein VapI
MLSRVKYAISYLTLNGMAGSQRELSKVLGYNESCFSQMLNGKKPLSKKFVEKLTSEYEVLNKDWLLSGEGEMIKGKVSQSAKGDNTINVSGNNVDMRNINQSKSTNDDAKRIKELEQRIEELLEDKKRLQDMVTKLLEKI